jgi:hypothetical protein
MLVAATKPLFPWECLEDSPSLSTLKKLLASIPDGQLLEGLRQHRGRRHVGPGFAGSRRSGGC